MIDWLVQLRGKLDGDIIFAFTANEENTQRGGTGVYYLLKLEQLFPVGLRLMLFLMNVKLGRGESFGGLGYNRGK